MTALSALLGGGFAALIVIAAPATAQYYPGYANPYWGNVPGPGGYGYGASRQIAINQCATAAQARLGAYGGGRVLGISDAVRRPDGGITVRGVATSGRYAYGYSYSYGYGTPAPADLSWRCWTDFRGYIQDVTIGRASYGYGYNYTPWNDDYSQFGYRRY
jgi:hypothetical protein